MGIGILLRKKMKKKIAGTIAIVFIIALIMAINGDRNIKLEGELNIQNFEVLNDISSSKSINVLGEYIFLMSPAPNDDDDTSWYEYPSFLVTTNENYQIDEIIQLDGYFEEIAINNDTLTVFSRKIKGNEYLSNVKTPISQESKFKDGQYGSFQKVDEQSVLSINEPIVGLAPNKITIIDEGKVAILEDPHFYLNNHQYFITDFTQNTNSVQVEAVR